MERNRKRARFAAYASRGGVRTPPRQRTVEPARAARAGGLGLEAVELNDADGSFGNLVGVGLGEGYDPSLLQTEARHRGPDAAQFAVEVSGRELDAGLHG